MTAVGVRRRGGLAAAAAAFTAGESSIAYLGNSITAQKAGYRPVLHTRLEALTGHHHRSINAGIGGVGSLGCGFLLPEIVLRHEPRLCFVECTSADMGGATPAWVMAEAVDGIVGRLLEAGTDVCLLHMPRAAREAGGAAVLALYERVAEHYAVPSIDVGQLVAAAPPPTSRPGAPAAIAIPLRGPAPVSSSSASWFDSFRRSPCRDFSQDDPCNQLLSAS